MAQSKKYRLLTNILTLENKNIKILKNDIEMFEYLIKWKNYINIITFDEGAVFASSKRSMSNTAISLDSFFYLIRKFDAILFYIVQREMSALASVRELSDFHYHKIEREEAYLYYNELIFDIKDIPPSPIPFHTKAIASFEICLDFDMIFKELSGIPIEIAYKKLAKIVKNPIPYYNKEYKEKIIS